MNEKGTKIVKSFISVYFPTNLSSEFCANTNW